jgi:hypothetical protein
MRMAIESRATGRVADAASETSRRNHQSVVHMFAAVLNDDDSLVAAWVCSRTLTPLTTSMSENTTSMSEMF